jgi:hypothetical protein
LHARKPLCAVSVNVIEARTAVLSAVPRRQGPCNADSSSRGGHLVDETLTYILVLHVHVCNGKYDIREELHWGYVQ